MKLSCNREISSGDQILYIRDKLISLFLSDDFVEYMTLCRLFLTQAYILRPAISNNQFQ